MKTTQVRIFLAEDNLGDVWLVEEALKRQSLSCVVDHYATAEAAIDAAKNCGMGGAPVPSLMLLDYNLPQGYGRDILAAAALNPNLTAVPKAIMTSFLQPEELASALRMGACLITKPADLEQFLRDVGTTVAALLRVGGGAAARVDNPAALPNDPPV